MNVLGMDMMGDVEGDLEGELEGYELEGGSVLGMSLVGDELGRGRRRGRPRGIAKPRWRNELAPGVPVPGYGVFPIPLTPAANNGTFTAAIANIEYKAVTQIPFRGERLVTRVTRSGTSAAAAQVFANNGVHIGIRPQVGVLGPMNLEDFTAQAFGVRMVMQPATQGAEIRVFAYVSPTLSGSDTLTLSIQILGRIAT